MQQFNSTEIVTATAGSGVVVTFDNGAEGARCELNALPIVETGVISRERDVVALGETCYDAYLDQSLRAGECQNALRE